MRSETNFGILTVVAAVIISAGNKYGLALNTSFTEVDLHEKLFKRYNSNVMPRTESSLPIEVGVEMNLLSIDNINEKKQTISVRAFLELTWKDAFLHWKPEEYDNVTNINVKVDDIWRPDIALENTFDKPTELGQENGNSRIDNDGNVVIWPYKTYTVACKIYIANFPFDEQTCTFQFLSWTNPSSVLKFQDDVGSIHLNTYSESGEWELVKTETHHRKKPYGSEFWDLLIFELKLKRKSLYHVMNLIVPVLCISLLNIVCFLLPSEGGERVTLSISIFLTLAVFLTIVNSSMPESSDEVAKFGVFVGLQLLGSALTIILTSVSLYIFHRSEKREINSAFRLIVRISCLSKLSKKYTLEGSIGKMASLYENGFVNGIQSNVNNRSNLNEESKTTTEASSKIHEEDKLSWKVVSRAMDRICFVSAFCWHALLMAVTFGTMMS